jgi:hypothetical protein
MLIYVKKIKNFLRTDRRTTQNYSSEPHNKYFSLKKSKLQTRTGIVLKDQVLKGDHSPF